MSENKTLSLLVGAYQADDEDSDDQMSGNISGSDDDQSSRHAILGSGSQTNSPAPVTVLSLSRPFSKASRLVSYGGDDIEDDEIDEETGARGVTGIVMETYQDDTEDEIIKQLDTSGENIVELAESLNSELASSLSRSVRNKSVEEIEIPAEPPGRCSKHLQEKIANFYKKKLHGFDMNAAIQKRKDFRNPSIYEKLIEFCGIDEKGTNYPPDVYNPHLWGKSSYYDELARIQKVEMDKREEERKKRTKVEFSSGIVKKSTSATDIDSDKKRKSKWDTQPYLSSSVSVAPPVVTIPSTGAKTVIPAMGSIKKK